MMEVGVGTIVYSMDDEDSRNFMSWSSQVTQRLMIYRQASIGSYFASIPHTVYSTMISVLLYHNQLIV